MKSCVDVREIFISPVGTRTGVLSSSSIDGGMTRWSTRSGGLGADHQDDQIPACVRSQTREASDAAELVDLLPDRLVRVGLQFDTSFRPPK